MGRIKTKLIKRITEELFSKHRDVFGTDFEKNKELVSKYTTVESKKLRNIIAGYVTRLVKTQDVL